MASKTNKFLIAVIGLSVPLAAIAAGAFISYGVLKGDVKDGVEGNTRSIDNRILITRLEGKMDTVIAKQDLILAKLTKPHG